MFNKKNIFVFVLIFGAIAVVGFYRYHSKKAMHQAQKIFTILEHHAIKFDIDAHSMDPHAAVSEQILSGQQAFIHQLYGFTKNSTPINMLLVGFPFKSINQDKKVIGKLPDMAERKSMEYLQAILDEIKTVYAPGCHITIFCDGIEFAEFFEIPFADVIEYEKALQTLISDLPDISLYTASDLLDDRRFTKLENSNTMIDTYPPTNEIFKQSVSPHVVEIAKKRFALDLDCKKGKEILKHKTVDEIIFGILARQARMRNFISEAFPEANSIRLTVHLSPDMSKKFGIKVSPSSSVLPYHGVCVLEKDGFWSIQFKKDVDLNHYALTSNTINGVNCPYFERI